MALVFKIGTEQFVLGSNLSGSRTTAVASASAPAQFGSNEWSLNDLGTGGDARIIINTLPDNGGSAITDLERNIDGGGWVSLGGTSTGNYDLTGLFTDGVSTDVQIRAVNAIGNGTASATKSVTTTTSSGPSISAGAAALAADIVSDHDLSGSTTTKGFQGWTSDAGFTTYTETTPDAVRTRIEAWKANPDGLIKIECDWDGILTHSNPSWRGPVFTALTADGGEIDGYQMPSGGVWLTAASGRSPVFGNPTINVYGMPRLFVENIGFAGQANGGNADNIRQIDVSATGTFPLLGYYCFKGCTFGLDTHRPSEPPTEYIKGIRTVGRSLHVEDCRFEGTRDAINGVVLHLRVFNNIGYKAISDFVTQFGFTAGAFSGQRASGWVQGNVYANIIDQSGFDGLHTDFFQIGTSADIHLGNDALCRWNVHHLQSSTSNDSGSQGTIYSDDHTSANNRLAVYENISAFTAVWGNFLYDPSGTGELYSERNIFMRAGDYLQSLPFEPAPRVGVGTTASPSNTPIVNNNYLTSVTHGSTSITESGNVYVDPSSGVSSGTGTTEGSPLRPETAFGTLFNAGVSRSGGDILTYTIANETSTDYETLFYAVADHFEPASGWAVDAGPRAPDQWEGAPARP